MSSQQFKTKGGATTAPFYKVCRYLCGCTGETGFGSSSTAEQVSAKWNGQGKTVVITGATSGLGVEIARVLAVRGADIVLAVRNVEKGREVVEQLTAKHPATAGHFTVMECDVSSIPSCAAFVKKFKESGKPLNVFMANAGIMACPFALTKDGYESQFATNHLGHFYIITELLDLMAQTAEQSRVQGRIVSLSSSAQHTLPPPAVMKGYQTIKDISNPDTYAPWPAYGFSKLAQIQHMRLLQQRIDSRGLNLAAVSCHPGFIRTGIQRNQGCLDTILSCVPCMLKSVPKGTATPTYLAVANKVEPGEYYLDVNVAPANPAALDIEFAERVWRISEEACRDALAKTKA